MTKLNKSRDSTLLQTAYPKGFNNEVPINSFSHINFNSGSQKSYISVDLKKPLHLKTICNEKIIRKTFGLPEKQVSFVDVVNFKIKCRNRQKNLLIMKLCVCLFCLTQTRLDTYWYLQNQ